MVALEGGEGLDAELRRNRLLASLLEERRTTDPALQLIRLEVGQVWHEAGDQVRRALFPLDCVVALAVVGDGEVPAEVTAVGREGMVGGAGLLGSLTHFERAVCRIAGDAAYVDAAALSRFAEQQEAGRLLRRYGQAMTASLLQRLACHRLHTIDARYACWLLQTDDQVGPDPFAFTQEALAARLGVQRTTVSLHARALQSAGLIRYARGTVTLLDRPGLEAAACGCYRSIRALFDGVHQIS